MSAFSRYIGIDYSGAETPEASLKGLRVYCAVGESAANEVPPSPSPRKYWTRCGIAHWLAARLAEDKQEYRVSRDPNPHVRRRAASIVNAGLYTRTG